MRYVASGFVPMVGRVGLDDRLGVAAVGEAQKTLPKLNTRVRFRHRLHENTGRSLCRHGRKDVPHSESVRRVCMTLATKVAHCGFDPVDSRSENNLDQVRALAKRIERRSRVGKQISTEQRGRVVVARFDNPPYGLMTMPMVEELNELVRRAEHDDGIGAVVLTGAQPDLFLAHYDVAELLAAARQSPPISEARAGIALRLIRRLKRVPGLESRLEHSQVGGVVALQRFHETLLRMGRSGVVYIAAINGATGGGGLELAMACDLRYLSDRGEVAQPEVLLGFPPGGGGTQRMARLIGRAAALQIMLTGNVLTPADAVRVGLVHEVVPHDEILEAACATAERLAMRYKPACRGDQARCARRRFHAARGRPSGRAGWATGDVRPPESAGGHGRIRRIHREEQDTAGVRPRRSAAATGWNVLSLRPGMTGPMNAADVVDRGNAQSRRLTRESTGRQVTDTDS